MNLIEEFEKLIFSLGEVKDRLEDALIDKDWEIVSEALYIISGARIDPPQEDDVLTQLMSRLDKLEGKRELKQVYLKEDNATSKKSRVPKTPEVTPSPKKRSTNIHNGKPNKFEEMTDLLSEVEKEPGYDKIKESKTRVKRRPPYKPAKVKCSRCHETFEVSPKLVKENFVCDDCIGK